MNQHFRRIFAALAITVLSGCAMKAQPYQIRFENQQSLAELGIEKFSVGVDGFEQPESFDSMCRLMGPIAAPEGETFGGYIRAAFLKELEAAKLHAQSNPKVTVKGEILKMSFGSAEGITNGLWTFEVLYTSSNGQSYRVSDSYKFSSGFDAISACNNTANAFGPAVGQMLNKTFSSLEFARLLK